MEEVVCLSILFDGRGYIVQGIIKARLLQFSLPYNENIPSLGLQLTPGLLVALLIARDLHHPEFSVGLWDGVVGTIFMTMPEAAVNKDDGVVLGQDDVRLSGKTLVICAIAESQAPEGMTQNQLRACVLGSVMRHTLKALLWSHDVVNNRTNLHRFN